VLDLRTLDLDSRGSVPLVGDWDFFPGVLLSGDESLTAPRTGGRDVPDQWSVQDPAGMDAGMGAGTYRLRVLLPESSGKLGILCSTVSTAFELDVNGALAAYAGKPALDARDAVAAYKPAVAILEGCPRELILVVRVSNHDYRVGGMWRSFSLGQADSLERRFWADTTGALALAASLAILAAVAAVLCFASGFGREYACFSLFALVAALRSLVTGVYAIVLLFPGITFSTVVRLEYLTVFLAYPFALLFFSTLFQGAIRGRGRNVLLAIAGAFLLLMPFAPLRVLTFSILPYYALIAAILVAITVIVARAVSQRRSGAVPLLVGAIVLGIASINDALFSCFLVNTRNLFPYGMLFFIGAQAYAIARRYRAIRVNLSAALDEKEILIKEVHHRVKNSLQIVSSIAALQSNRTSNPEVLDACRAMQARIRAISIVHERLYSLGALNEIDIGDYIRDLAAQFSSCYGREGGGILVDAQSMMLPGELCIDVGLIMTELVSNSYKYAMGNDMSGKVRVRAAREGTDFVLAVSDDGPGFPEGFAVGESGTLGFRMISVLAKKRGAAIKIANNGGAVVEIRFPTMGANPT